MLPDRDILPLVHPWLAFFCVFILILSGLVRRIAIQPYSCGSHAYFHAWIGALHFCFLVIGNLLRALEHFAPARQLDPVVSKDGGNHRRVAFPPAFTPFLVPFGDGAPYVRQTLRCTWSCGMVFGLGKNDRHYYNNYANPN